MSDIMHEVSRLDALKIALGDHIDESGPEQILALMEETELLEAAQALVDSIDEDEALLMESRECGRAHAGEEGMTREELERVEREMVDEGATVYVWAAPSDKATLHRVLQRAFTRHAEHRASVPRTPTDGQIALLEDFARMEASWPESGLMRMSPGEFCTLWIERAGPEPFLGPQPQRESAAAITGTEPQADWQLRQTDRELARKGKDVPGARLGEATMSLTIRR